MIVAYAFVRCDHPGCQAAVMLPTALRYGQLNPLQVVELKRISEAAGWVGNWVEGRVEHFCPAHRPPPLLAEMVAALAERIHLDSTK